MYARVITTRPRVDPFSSSAVDPDVRQIEVVREERDLDREVFDRLAYAARALRLLRPAGLTVALCPGTERLRVEVGADLHGNRGARWAIVSIPPDASRAHIALRLAALAGRANDPFVLDLLMREVPSTYRRP